MQALKDRLQFALRESGKSQSDLAKYCGIATASVSNWFTGKTKTLAAANAVRAASFLGVSLDWLVYGKGEPHDTNVHAIHPEDPLPAGVVAIPEYRITFGAGSQEEPTYEEITEAQPAYYREDWFQARHTASDKCKRFRVHGDSMEPWIFDGDKILVDTSEHGRRLRDGCVYAFVMGDGELRVKQLFTMMSGAIRVHSKNPLYPDEMIEGDDLDRFHLVGRVIDRSGGSFL